VATESLRDEYTVVDPIGRNLLEEGLTLREKLGGELTVISAAPAAGDEILADALRYGADRAVRLWHEDLTGADTWLISRAIKGLLEKTGFDLALCGARSGDTGSGLMVSFLAHHLGVVSATGIIDLEVDGDNGIVVHKKLQKGRRETYRLKCPAVLGLEEGINEPRYVAPFSRTYREGMRKKPEFFQPDPAATDGKPLVKLLRLSQSRPRVKVGMDVSSLSMQDRLKMMRGELGREKEEIFQGSPEEAARKIFSQIKDILR
jgi:electron transfer flavoprotein alpha/beta subunit